MKPALRGQPRSWAAALILTMAACLAACRSVEPPVPSCSYGGTQYALGATFPASDGCNRCTCGDDSTVSCTEKACLDGGLPDGPPPGPPGQDGPPRPATDAAGPRADSAGPPSDAATGTCQAGGRVYQPGESFPAEDGCNTCVCLPDGQGACTRKACLDAAAACDLPTRYEYGDVGGLRIFVDRSALEPGNRYTRTRTPVVGTGPILSCSPPLPGCGTAGVLTALDIEAAFQHPDVRAALAEPSPPLFGRDTRPVDGTVFEVRRQDGRSFLVGMGCNSPNGCRAIPGGINQLARGLRDLDRQQLEAPECQALRMPR
jgi:hypothetical protein